MHEFFSPIFFCISSLYKKQIYYLIQRSIAANNAISPLQFAYLRSWIYSYCPLLLFFNGNFYFFVRICFSLTVETALIQQIIKMNKQYQMDEDQIAKILPTHLPQFKGKSLKFQKRLGMTNITFKVEAEGVPSVIFRVLSPIVDRKYENAVLVELEKNKICPRTLYSCETYRIQEFIDNVEHPKVEDICKNSELMKKIIVKLFQMHQVKFPNNLVRSFLDEIVFTEKGFEKYNNLVCLQKGKENEFKNLKEKLMEQFHKVHKNAQSYFKNKQQSFKLSHNDANSGNIFVRKNGNKEIILIDFQYACCNYVSYDIANFLNQCCFQYHSNYPGFTFSKKVSESDIQKGCDFYPGKYKGIEKDVHFMLMICNYFWGLWSLEAAPSPNFSPIEHGLLRYQLFKHYAENQAKL